MSSIDERLRAFVEWRGEIPREAVRIEDHRAREHAVDWIRRNIGVGIVHPYVIGYELGQRWWTLFADRIDTVGPDGAECWNIEAYDHDGKSWSDRYFFWPEHARWRRASALRTGDDYGRGGARVDERFRSSVKGGRICHLHLPRGPIMLTTTQPVEPISA